MQTLLISQRLHIGDRHRAVGDRHRDVDQDLTRIVPGAAFPQPVSGLAERSGQADPVRKLGQQRP